MKKFILIIIFTFFVLLAVSCESTKYSLSFENEEMTVVVNEEINFIISTNIENLNELKFSFNAEEFIEYTNNKYLAVKPGKVIATVYWEKDIKIRDTVEITILDIERKITFTDDSLTIYTNDIINLNFDLINLTTSDLGYRLSNPSTVSITNDWKIQAISEGAVTLTVFYLNNDEIFAELPITVQTKKSIKFSSNTLLIENMEKTNLPIELVNISMNEISFAYSNSDIIKIENNFIVPLKSGTLTLTAVFKTDPSVFSSIDIEVKEIKPIYTVNDYEYWVENLDSKYNPSEVILNNLEINEYNNKILSNYTATKVVDLFNQPKTISKSSLEALINRYSNMNSYKVFSNGIEVTTSDKNAVLLNRNIANITSIVDVKYGIITDFAALRSYPTNFYSNSNSMDRFQETGLNVGEGLIVYHTSSDGKWYFVQAQNYNGWVESKNVALCTYNEMDEFLNSDNFIIITADKINLNNVDVRMGQRFPYISKSDVDFLVKFPTRNNLGNLELIEMNLSKDLDISDGYLDYTLENVYKQGFKMLGIDYSWGDKYIDGRDCSSTQNAIYACFGFKMPRNTSNQSKIPNYSLSVKGIAISTLKDQYMPGTLIFTSSHVLMYIGEDINGVSYVYHNTSSGIPGCKVQSLASYGTNSIIATLKLYN